MSLTNVTYRESCTERERIKIMLKELQEDEARKLSESSAEGTYVSTKKLLDLSIDDDFDMRSADDITIITTTPAEQDVQTKQVPTMVSFNQRGNLQTITDEVDKDPLKDELKSIGEEQYDEEQYDEEQYDEEQYDEEQYDEEQYDEEQYDEEQYEEEQYEEEQYDEEQYDEELHDEYLLDEDTDVDQFELIVAELLCEYMSEADSAEAYGRAQIYLVTGDVESGVKLLEEIGLKSYNIRYTVRACLELMNLNQKDICSFLDQVILKEKNICERLNVKYQGNGKEESKSELK